jgi:hypothetical protein
MIQFWQKQAELWTKAPNFFANFFGENIILNRDIRPRPFDE